MRIDRFRPWAAVVGFVVAVSPGVAGQSGPHFVDCVNIPTPNAATISVKKALNREKQPLKQGDEVAVFDDNGVCMGAVSWKTGVGNAIRAQGADPQFEIPGFSPGDTMRFRIWDQSTEREYRAVAGFETPKGHSGTFLNGGIFVVEIVSDTEPLAVELVDFHGKVEGELVVLEWMTATETTNSGFEVQHSRNGLDYSAIGFTPGAGTTAEPRAYRFASASVWPGLNYYRLKAVDLEGGSTFSPVVEVYRELPGPVSLSEPFPHPADRWTRFSVALERSADIEVDVWDLAGRRLSTVYQGFLQANESRAVDLSTASVPAGLYLLTVRTNAGQEAARPFLIRH